MRKELRALFAVIGFLMVHVSLQAEGDLKKVSAAVHINTDVSSGAYTPEMLAAMTVKSGLRAIFMTENLLPEWEYGLRPFRGIIKRVEKRPGLISYGLSEYAERIESLDVLMEDTSVLMSAEVAPYYYWTGNPFSGRGLILHDWDIQLLVMGLEPYQYAGIPTVSGGGFSCYGLCSVVMLWPIALIVIGALSLKKKSVRFYLSDTVCWLLIITGAFLLLRNYPFRISRYDQYDGPAGAGPYQEVIDHVDSLGGMTFWSSPEAVTNIDLGPVRFISGKALKFMYECRNYTGFCCFYEGYREIGGPGGVWDIVLSEHCEGSRKRPVWAIGEMAYHDRLSSGGKDIDEVRTVFLVKENSRDHILEAMKSGRMFAVRRSDEQTLDIEGFQVINSEGRSAVLGETIEAAGQITLKSDVSWEGGDGRPVIVKVIKMGEVVKEFSLDKPATIEFKDVAPAEGEKVYYRLDIRGKYPSMLFSNPVFVLGVASEELHG